jgi:tetratricopeptide (TPR) repeat protein
MLETVREYAAERLAEAGAEVELAVRRRHRRYYAEFAAVVGGRYSESPKPENRIQLDLESGNLSAALDQAATDGDETDFGQLIVGTLNYWFYTGRMAQGERWLALSDASHLPAHLRAHVLRVIGNVALVKGDLARAIEPLDGAVAAAREVGEPLLLARVLSIRSLAYRHSGNTPRALEYVDEALRVGRSALDEAPATPALSRLLGVLHNERGEILDNLGSTGEARALFETYRQQSLLENDQSHLAWALINLSLSALDRGQEAMAKELMQSALRAGDEGGSTPIQGDTQMAAGLVEALVGDPATGVRLEVEAARKIHGSGLLLTLPDTISLLGVALLRSGQPVEAARMLAAGAAWRTDRGLVTVSRITRRSVAAAEAELAQLRSRSAGTELGLALDDSAARGAGAPFGWIEALDLPPVDAPAPAQIHLVDLGQRAAGAATSP